jgi:hypothetical protein
VRFRSGLWAGIALVVAGTACVSIPSEVRANFAEAEPHENSYFRTRSDAPSPRGFLSDAEKAAAGQNGGGDASAATSATFDGDAGSLQTPSAAAPPTPPTLAPSAPLQDARTSTSTPTATPTDGGAP